LWGLEVGECKVVKEIRFYKSKLGVKKRGNRNAFEGERGGAVLLLGD